MFCTNEPCENETVPESGDLRHCRTCLTAWQSGFRQWSQAAIQATTYHTHDSLLIRLPKPFDENLFPGERGPDVWPPDNTLPFRDLFDPLPSNRLSFGYLDLGEARIVEQEGEFPIPFYLGPDGKVWAEVGDVEDLPAKPETDRETLACQMLAEFLEAAQDWLTGLCAGGPTRDDLHTWPVSRVMHWLQQPATLPRTDPKQRRLITGLLNELRGLGFQPKA